MSACEQLYRLKNFREITIKEIGNATSFTRTSIYNYFQTKEEIFLALFEREYRLWTASLEALAERETDDLPRDLARTIADRELMLKLLSVNLYDMEENSRLERLVDFKCAYGASVEALDRVLQKHRPALRAEERRNIVQTLLQFTHGIYPYANATVKQLAAMERAGVRYKKRSVFDIALTGFKLILKE